MNRLVLSGSVAVLLVGGAAGIVAVSDQREPDVVNAVSSPETTDIEPVEPTTTTVAATTTTARVTTTLPPTTTTTLRIEPLATRHGTPSAPLRPGVRLTLRLERTTYAVGEELPAVFVIENGSDKDLVLNGNHCSVEQPGLYRNGRWAGGYRGRGCNGRSRPPLVIPPGATHETTFAFDTSNQASDRPERPLAPGRYQAAAAAIFQGDLDTDAANDVAWFAPSIDVEVK